MNTYKWNFPGNGYTADNGLDTPGIETFKDDPISSLAREIVQNSIDARKKSADGPVRIEFNVFKMKTSLIPDASDLKSQIDACINTHITDTNKKIVDELNTMKSHIKEEYTYCLRISDFNTTGLNGVDGPSANDDSSPWHNLVKGSGLSNKIDTSGGSKGIGKYATFVNSFFNTVFYSTLTDDGYCGHIGICSLCSAKIEGSKEKTIGIGYYGRNDFNDPILEQCQFDPKFVRNESGTDIYIFGFKKTSTWVKDIITKIFDSFIYAIVKNSIEIIIDGHTINSENLNEYIYNTDYIDSRTKIGKNIIGQYLLATRPDVYKKHTAILGYGNVDIFVLDCTNKDKEYGNCSCSMIRYPYMKIKEEKNIFSLPCKAMCVIGGNDLNKKLREIENPQHTKWEFKRIDDADEQAEMREVYSTLLKRIKDYISSVIFNSDTEKTNLEGAEKYIPFESEGESALPSGNASEIKRKTTIRKGGKKYKAKSAVVNASIYDDIGDGVIVDFMNKENNDDEVITPDGRNFANNGDIHLGDKPSAVSQGGDDKIGLKSAKLRSLKYNFICLNKKTGSYRITFKSEFEEPNVKLELVYDDDNGPLSDNVNIKDAKINGNPVIVEDGNKIPISLSNGEQINIDITTDQTDLFSAEVMLYAYR